MFGTLPGMRFAPQLPRAILSRRQHRREGAATRSRSQSMLTVRVVRKKSDRNMVYCWLTSLS